MEAQQEGEDSRLTAATLAHQRSDLAGGGLEAGGGGEAPVGGEQSERNERSKQGVWCV